MTIVNYKDAKILFYDIETLPLKFLGWQPGPQYVGHKQLLSSHKMWDLICVQYCWNDGKGAKVLRYDVDGGTKGIIEKFDAVVKEADVIIGKNNTKFDNKMMNAFRLFNDVEAFPEWALCSDDLETHMRRNFRFPSQSLDYISDMLGLGGKIKMIMQDWEDILNYRELSGMSEYVSNKALDKLSNHLYGYGVTEICKDGEKALAKMCKYGKKDVIDTRTVWEKLERHIQPKFNMGVHMGKGLACKHCGSEDITKDGDVTVGNVIYKKFKCKTHLGYAGRARPLARGGFGKML